ncbi:MAG: DUF3231 family protein [Firmicutes bacterium]|nr:DUF3231 family protein [Bacillota bacterium]
MEQQTFTEENLSKTPPLPVTHETRLSSSEIANLWRTCMLYSMTACVMQYFQQHVQDRDIKSLVQESLSIAETGVNIAADFLKKDKRAVPRGFGDQDVDLEAPALFSDVFYLYYISNQVKVGLNVSSMACTMASRPDIRDFYIQCIESTLRFWGRISDTLLSKGLMIRPPYVATVEKVDFVKKQSFLGGLFGQERSLLAIEIEQLYFGTITNEIGRTLLTGFRQTARSSEVRSYMERGLKLASKYIKLFGDKLREGDISSPMHWDAYGNVTESTVPSFSDKLMMFHTVLLNAFGIANYGVSLSSSMRSDVVTTYAAIIPEVASYTEDGINIMIDNGWFEEPPRVLDRDKLSNVNIH